jgi:hypothetical protein
MLLTKFLEYSQAAWNAVNDSDPRSPLRYGQALYQLLPEHITNQLVFGETDFYYWHNDGFSEINEICYNLCSDYNGGEE